MLKPFIFGMLFFVTIGASSQDIHFSQYGNVPFYLNPAKTGLMSEQFRISANTKIQWSSVTKSFQTYLVGGDMSFQSKGSYLEKFGLGCDVMREKAGDADFGTFGFGTSLSYIKALNRFNNRFISIGFSARMHQRSFNPSNLTFDNQFNGLTFDPQLPGGETFSDISFWYPVFGLGSAYMMRFGSQEELMIGLSTMNINRPKQSHYSDSDIKLCTRWVADFSYKSPIGRNSAMIPSVFFSKQGVFTEVILGTDYRFIKNFNPWDYKAYSGGLFFRVGDGFILSARLDFLNYKMGISYDINISKLTPASQLRGGFEFSFIVVINKSEHKANREIPCPIF